MKTNWPALRHGYVILASMALANSSVLAQTPAGRAAAVISSVAITQVPQRAAVRVEGQGRLDAHAARLQNPDRLVLDFAGARLAVQQTVIPGISAPVRGVRIGQYRPDVVRVVVDLTTASPYQVSRDGDAVVIYFEGPSTTPEDSAPRVTTLASRQMETTRPEFGYSAVSPRLVAGRAAKDLQISAPRFGLPGELTQPSLTLASFSGKKEAVRPDSTTEPARAGQAVPQANRAATAMATSVATQATQAPAAAAPAAGKYTGEPISVNLKDVDLKDFFRLIHEISGLNVVLDPAVKGSLTIVLDEVPWDQALDIVMQNNSLDKQLSGNVLRIATRSFARDIGTQLAFSGTGLGGRNIIGGDSDVGKSNFGTTNPAPPISIANSTPPVMPFVSNLAAGAPTSGLLLAHRSTNFAVDFFITAAEAKGVGKLLSKPKVITQNNEKATVKQGTKIPIQTTINNTISVQYIDAVLKLEVTPQITAEGTIFMDVLVENTQIDQGIPRIQGVPALDTQAAETKVTVADGGTVVIGGVIISSQRVDIQEVPIIGSLPLIGNLFRRRSVTTSSQELLFFLTPRIIPG